MTPVLSTIVIFFCGTPVFLNKLAQACANLFKKTGVPQKNITMVDRTGVIYRGRDNLNQWKSSHAIETKDRTLDDAITNADIFLGLSAKGALTKNMVKKMAKNPIIFACANPDPEITPEEIEEVRDDAIIATGRSDYPNQVNNLIGFPYIFRGALDVRSKTINEEMKIAAAHAIAKLANFAIACAAAIFISSLIVFDRTSNAPLKIYGNPIKLFT